jgi:cytosolic carboxypeptidase protein 2/3
MLREKFIFKIIPMLNPDGVINGNYRCSLAGCDLNRRWKGPHKQLHPTVYHTKKLIRDLHNERGVILYCDLHGHSRKQNVFMYGCNNKMIPTECRVFPLILSKLSGFFDFSSCRFGVQKTSIYKDLKTCPNIFTMESTFSGVDIGDRKGDHMRTTDFEKMGQDLCRTLLIYTNTYIPPELEHIYGNKNGDTVDIEAMMSQELKDDQKLMAAGDGDSSGGSDSEPSEDNLPVEEVCKVVPIVDKK